MYNLLKASAVMDVLSYFACVITLGIAAQWLAWRLHLPAILLLLICGFFLLPLYGILTGDRDVSADTLIDANVLFPIVSLSVAIILFEGGLTLRFNELQGTGPIVTRLVTIGLLITWLFSTWCAWSLLNMQLQLAALLGAILTVSGPTVVGPLLRYVRPEARVGSLAKWEGIINDPLGVVLAVLVFEAIRIGGLEEVALATGFGLVKTAMAGLLIGGLAALALVQLLKRYLIPDYLQSAMILAVVIGLFALSNAIQNESGLLTVTVMGIALANQKTVTVKHVIEFKENLRVLLISTLFILLASRVQWSELKQVGWQGIVFLMALLLIRPVAVFASTVGSDLKLRERAFLAWLHPRGIVAAAVASLFALELEHLAHSEGATESMSELAVQAEALVPLTFLVIVGTVAVYGLTISPLARWLKVSQPNRGGILFAGAEEIVRTIAKSLHDENLPVLLVDTNQCNIARARMEGLPTCYASVLSEYVQEEMELNGIGRFLAMTPNDEINSLAALEFVDVFGRSDVYQLAPEVVGLGKHSQVSQHLRARLLFGGDVSSSYLRLRMANGAVIKKTRLGDEFAYDHFRELYGASAVVMFVILKSGEIEVCTADSVLDPQPGQTLISLVNPKPESQEAGNDSTIP